MHLNLAAEFGAFARHYGGSLQLRRNALIPEKQTANYLPTAIPNPKDSRGFGSDFREQAAVLPPDVLATIVREAIASELDLNLLATAQARQAEIRAELRKRLNQVSKEGDHLNAQLLGDLSHVRPVRRAHPPADISLDGWL